MKRILEYRELKRKWIAAFLAVLFLCVYIDAAAEDPVRSSSLEEIVTRGENTLRIDYVNEQGEISFAADKQYATMMITTEGDLQIVEYFDAEGNPARQRMGQYALYRWVDESGRIWKVTFLGINKEPILCSNGYSSYIRTFYENGNIKAEHYLDEQGNPIRTGSYGYGCYREYDDQNRNTILTYLDENDHPVVTTQGFAIAQRSFYEDGDSADRIKEEFYFDAEDRPAVLSHGQSGRYIEYDQYGRDVLFTYLDADGHPIKTLEGYTTVKRKYNDDDTIESEMYFDREGNPVSLSEGQYGVRYISGRQVYLDQEGKEQINIRRILYNNELAVIASVLLILLISALVGKKENGILLVLYIAAILYMTLMYRTEVPLNSCPLPLVSGGNGFFISRGMINNIMLFLPLGAILYRLYSGKTVILIPILFSIGIELIQYLFRIGFCEWVDVLCNSIGGLLGYTAGYVIEKIKKIRNGHERTNQSKQ